MNRIPLFLINLMLLCTFGCNNPKTQATDGTQLIDFLINDSNDESLAFWTADTIIKTNPHLVRLMDSLYQYVVRNELPENDDRTNRKWMQEYRNQLCNYYKETRQSDSISDFAMADSIIAEANALWSLDNDESTMGMIISNGVERTRLTFQQYNEYEKLNSICESEEQREILLEEFTEWLKLESLFYRIFANCVDLQYWGGTIRGPMVTRGELEILKTHIELYKKEYSIISNSVNQWEDNGTFLRPAQNLLISCSKQALEKCDYNPCHGEDSIEYNEIYKETKSLLNKLPDHIDTWCKSRQPWEENEMYPGWLCRECPRHTSEVLIKLAHIISSI